MFGLVKQEEVDLELSIAHYFFWRVVNISKQNAHEYFSAAADANQYSPESIEQSIQEFQWAQMTLLNKYNKIIDVLKNELDHKGLLRSVVESYDSRNIDPEVYSRWVKCTPGNELKEQTTANKRNHTKRKRSGNADDEEDDIMEVYNENEKVARLPTRNSVRVSENQNDANFDEIDRLLEENGLKPFASLQTKNLSASNNFVDENDAEFERASFPMTAENLEILRAAKVKKVDRLCQSMQLKVEAKLQKQEEQMLIKQLKIEEKLKLQEEQLQRKQKKFNEEMKRKDEKFKKKEAQHKLKELRFLKREAKHQPLNKSVVKEVKAVAKEIKPCWDEYFNELLHFRTIYGNCRVTSDSDLGKWVYHQRRMKREKSRNITPEQIEKLNRIGFEWAIVNATPFATRVMNFHDLRKKDTTQKETNNDEDVNKWIYTTLEQYNSRLTTGKYKTNIAFAERLTELALVQKMGGDINSTNDVMSVLPDNSTLRTWIASIRKQYKCYQDGEPHTLTDDQRMLLVELGFNFTPTWSFPINKVANNDEKGNDDKNDDNKHGDDKGNDNNNNNNIRDGNDEHGTDTYESETDYDDSETEMDETVISVVTLVAGKKRSIRTQTDTSAVESEVVPVEEIAFEEKNDVMETL